MDHPLLRIRQLAGETGVYSLSHLAALEQLTYAANQTELAGLVGISNAALSQALTLFERHGLVSRSRNAGLDEDRRLSVIRRTKKADTLLQNIQSVFTKPKP